MLDASTLPFEENIAKVKTVVEKAQKYGATVEAELGLVGGSEDGSCDHGIRAQIRTMQLFMQERQELMHLQLPLVMLTEIIR